MAKEGIGFTHIKRHLDDWGPAKGSISPNWANGIHNRKLKLKFSTEP